MRSQEDNLLKDLTSYKIFGEDAKRIVKLALPHERDSKAILKAWRDLSKSELNPEIPFEVHRLLHDLIFKAWDTRTQGPRPTWIPNPEDISSSNLISFMDELKGSPEWDQQASGDVLEDYKLLQTLSYRNIEFIWPKLLKGFRLSYATPPDRILQPARNPDEVRWLPGSKMNIAACALCNRNPSNIALIWAEEGSPKSVSRISLEELRLQCLEVAGALQNQGYKPGTAIGICMPMTPLSVIIYLGIVLAGCVVVGIADSFSAAEIQARIRISDAKLIFTQDLIHRDGKSLSLYERVLKKSSTKVIVLPSIDSENVQVNLRRGDISWKEFMKKTASEKHVKIHMAESSSFTNILFSSGTTGDPKAIPWTHITPIRCGIDAWAQMDVKEGEVMAFPTNLGWMMGPWLIYAALLNGATIALFKGSPLGRAFGEFVSSAKVKTLGTVPSIVRAWRKANCLQGLDWRCIKNFISTGEASSIEDSFWLEIQAGYKPIIEMCGGTEIGGGFIAGSMIQPQCPSTFSSPSLGSNLVLLEGEGDARRQSFHESGECLLGELALVPPYLGSSQHLLNADNYKVYYAGMPRAEGSNLPLRRHGDVFERLPGGYYCAHGRADDTMNLGGIKVSSVELERACLKFLPSEILECAAVAVPQKGGGPDSLVIFVVLKGTRNDSDSKLLLSGCQKAIRTDINPLFKVSKVLVVDSLPRTATNKVMRRTLRTQLMNQSKL